MIWKKILELFKSNVFQIILIALGAVIVLLVIFYLGFIVGVEKAGFSGRWGENYHSNFAGPRQGFFEESRGRDLLESHGVFGQIIKIDNQNLIIQGSDNIEKVVVVKEDTVINLFNHAVKLADFKINDLLVVIGDPNSQGQIEAKLIRVMPAVPPPALPFNEPKK